MTFDQAVEEATRGNLVTRPGFYWRFMGFDARRAKLYTVDHNEHKTQFHPVKIDRACMEWRILTDA